MAAPTLERSAVVSCHVERVLDDAVWARFESFLRSRPAGFVVTPFLRPPDAASGEDERTWLDRARRAASLAPFGHHTHWGGPTQARPPAGVDASATVAREAKWLRAHGLEPRFFCGGGWFLDERLAETLAGLGYVDCTATTFRQSYLAADAARLQLAAPCRLRLGSGNELLELPATHSAGMLARGLLGIRGPVHVHFHDWELVDARRRVSLLVLLQALRIRRRPTPVDELAALCAGAPERSWPGTTIRS